MKNVLILFATLMATSVFANGPVKVDLSKSVINWKAAKVTGEHTGTVQLKAADLQMENGVLTGGSFVADMTSLVVTDLTGEYAQKLEGHLKSDDFFSVANHNEAQFVMTGVTPSNAGSGYTITGDLTIKGITQPITFDAQMTANSATATLKVDRTKYDIKYGSGSFFQGLGDKMIYDEFNLDIQLVF